MQSVLSNFYPKYSSGQKGMDAPMGILRAALTEEKEEREKRKITLPYTAYYL